ncbi:MAG TPA: DUF1501 domain-containing protein [Planctomycetota bacterium]|nr:DUF1501 domain-containing protein [Planctomycetota bacterium]
MFDFTPCACNSDRVSRRNFLRAAFGGAGGLAMAPFAFAQDTKVKEEKKKGGTGGKGKAKSVILLWMGGGPSQLDTFDPKAGHENGGPFKALDTAVKGVQISEHLPTVAAQMQNLALVRSIYTGEPEHFRASYMMHTGVKFLESFPYPSMGSLISYELSDTLDTPGYVSVGSGSFGPTFLGYEHAPFVIDNPNGALQMLRDAMRQKETLKLADELSAEFDATRGGLNVKKRDTFYERIEKILESSFSKALDINQEPQELRDAYGKGRFGQGCLLARRLVQAGVKFIEVHLGGWDTHENNFDRTQKLMGELDPGFGTLVRDLKEKNLLDETLVLWMGEFGRTPMINKDKGRDHWANGFSIVIGGGGVQGGRLVGETDKTGCQITREPTKVADLLATIYSSVGIDPKKKYYSPQGSLVKATEDGEPIKKLLA